MARRSKEVNEQVSLKLKDAAVIFNQAKKLNQRCQIFRDSLRLLRGKEFASVEVEDGVRRQCEELEERLRHLQEQRNSFSSDISIDDIECLTAQLALWRQQKPEGVTTSTTTTPILLMQLQHVVRQQQALLAITRGTRLSLDQELEKEQQLLKESQQMKSVLEEKLKQNQATDNTGHELARKIKAMEDHYDMLTQKLKHFLQTHISSSSDERPTITKGKRKRQATLESLWKTSQDNQTSPEQTIMGLIEQTVQNPHDPYMECDDKFAQLLHRVGVVQSHPDNPTLIRMTPFHH